MLQASASLAVSTIIAASQYPMKALSMEGYRSGKERWKGKMGSMVARRSNEKALCSYSNSNSFKTLSGHPVLLELLLAS